MLSHTSARSRSSSVGVLQHADLPVKHLPQLLDSAEVALEVPLQQHLHRQHASPLHQRHLRHRIGVEGRLAQRVVRDRHGWPLRMPDVQANYGADSRMRRIMWVVETALV